MRHGTLQLAEFVDARYAPRYAILSHRWEEDEVSYKDFVKGRKQDGKGAWKIQRCCEFAREQGYEWVWIDTCCIDKRSSAELSESINSMFKWYARADVCFAYLSDVCQEPRVALQGLHTQHDVLPRPPDYLDRSYLDNLDLEASIRRSAWFTRGWTLQELLAPRTVFFLDRSWSVLGAKCSNADVLMGMYRQLPVLNDLLADITGIAHVVLDSRDSLFSHCVAQRLSWAARRSTTRLEDMAYCLIGMFDINMPLLYGEGREPAFIRLQKEILSKYEDDSIFTWHSLSSRGPSASRTAYLGLLARLPTDFAQCNHPVLKFLLRRPPFTLTSRGIKTRLTKAQHGTKRQGAYCRPGPPRTVLLRLNCLPRSCDRATKATFLELQRLPRCGHYARVPVTMYMRWDVIANDRSLMPLGEEEFIYVHATYDDAIACALVDRDYLLEDEHGPERSSLMS